MLRYTIVEIAGKQYKAEPDKEFKVEINGIDKLLEIDKVLAIAEDDKIKIGDPYIKGEKVTFDVIGEEKGVKIRVATFKAKSNTRKVIGSRRKLTKIKMQSELREKA